MRKTKETIKSIGEKKRGHEQKVGAEEEEEDEEEEERNLYKARKRKNISQ